MNWFQNASTRAKLLTGFGLMMLLLAILFGTAYFAITSLIQSQQRVFEHDFLEVVDAITIDATESDIRAAMLTLINATNRSEIEALRGFTDQKAREATDTFNRLLKQNQDRPQVLRQLEAWSALRLAYKATREQDIFPAILAGRWDTARSLSLNVQAERFNQMRAITTRLIEDARTEARQAMEDAKRHSYRLLAVAGAVSLLSLFVGSVLVAYLSRLIASPLRTLLAWTEKTAAGDLSVEIPSTSRRDEIGILQGAFRRMLDSLRAMNRDIQESVNVLASSASQILTATSEMAATASQTAAASTQTTATVEEVKQTAQVSSSKSRQVADIAQRAARDAETGRAAVDEGIEGMTRIRSQMEAIAESIVRLSEQSQAIGEIISSVNDLAEQSNLLAVNASIEAAKAGEQGKGFAVVAQEIRNLAAQSKQATAQVRSILGDIQKATSSAVQATEQGSKAVETGAHQSVQAGQAIRALADSIAEAAEAAQQISASSEQQSVGMDQVAQAMESIKQAANQNAKATKQAETGARNLHDLGQKLKRLVGRFKM